MYTFLLAGEGGLDKHEIITYTISCKIKIIKQVCITESIDHMYIQNACQIVVLCGVSSLQGIAIVTSKEQVKNLIIPRWPLAPNAQVRPPNIYEELPLLFRSNSLNERLNGKEAAEAKSDVVGYNDKSRPLEN